MSVDEEFRLRTLHSYNVLDTAAEKAFDDLTGLAATLCESPISLVSLVAEDRQWFKSRHGLDVTETPREQAFCAHAILEGERLMVVEDTRCDRRFAANPLVTGEPRIRFYAGAPLVVANGARLGTLCVIDRKPHVLTALQREALDVLRNAVVAQLELHRAASDLRALESLVPMCAWCRNVRLSEGDYAEWVPLHRYVATVSPVSHCICPACSDALRV